MYKTIPIYADQLSRFERRPQLAATLAPENNSHLIGKVASGRPQPDHIVFDAMTLAPPPARPVIAARARLDTVRHVNAVDDCNAAG